MAALEVIHEASIERMRAKSELQTAFLLEVLETGGFSVITPKDAKQRGCQLSLQHKDAKGTVTRLQERGIICDFRPPDIVRVAPSPLYNTFADLLCF